MKYLVLIFVLCLTGCFEYAAPPPDVLTTALEIIDGLTTVNVASAPLNPYVVPIGIGLTGLTAMLEALRRKERSSRKHAEGKLNNGGNTT